MARSPETEAPSNPSAGQFEIDAARPLPHGGGGLPAFAARDRASGQGGLMALQVARDAPARAMVLRDLTNAKIENLTIPLAHQGGPAPGGGAYYVICPAPPGRPLSMLTRPWSEPVIIGQVLRPIAQILVELEARRITHRAIRPNNVFEPQANLQTNLQTNLPLGSLPVTLGAAWAAPPAMHQPEIFEPPYSAMCHPSGRGDGQIADDVYALGVLLIVLATGRVPLSTLDPIAAIRRKLELGSFAALTAEEKLPPIIADLVRNMLAEDPEHRPPPALLLDPFAARGRRVAARPPRRAQRPLQIGSTTVWDARTLSFAIGTQPEAGFQSMRTGDTMQWLRRTLGDATLAVRIEELLRHRATEGRSDDTRADAATVMRAVVLIDPLSPLCWRGTVLWPDAMGPAMAMGVVTEPTLVEHLEELIILEMIPNWAMLRPDRCDFTGLRIESRRHRSLLQTRGPGGGQPRLIYSLNALLPCLSPLTRDRWVANLADMVPALEAAVGADPSGSEPLDPHIVAFIAARSERRLDREVNGLNGSPDEAEWLIARLRLLAQLQLRYNPRPLPRLAGWFAAKAGPLVALWNNRTRRAEVASAINTLATAGHLTPMLALIEDPAGRSADTQGARTAAQDLMTIEGELASITDGGPHRTAQAARIGQEAAAVIGLAALAAMMTLAAIG